jgi:hypothetical protein
MSILDFPEKRAIRYFENNEEAKMGSFKLANNCELKYICVLLLMIGNYTTEKIRTKIYSSSDYNAGSLLYTSSWRDLIDAAISNYYVWLRTDFANQNINKEHTYYLACEISNYTRNAYNKYAALVYDAPEPIYGTDANSYQNNPLSFKVYDEEVIGDAE